MGAPGLAPLADPHTVSPSLVTWLWLLAARRFRRNHLVPVLEVDSIAELNSLIDQYDQDDDQRHIAHRLHTVGESFIAEKTLLEALPVERFETGRSLTPRVDRYSRSPRARPATPSRADRPDERSVRY
ncbi:MAG: hypothetical protein ABI746_13555 [Dermatophilaceae bacterium]